MITVKLTLEQAQALALICGPELDNITAFLSSNSRGHLATARDELITAINLSKEGLMSRVESAVEDYLDACDYDSFKCLTGEDWSYLAGELQLGVQDLRKTLGV